MDKEALAIPMERNSFFNFRTAPPGKQNYLSDPHRYMFLVVFHTVMFLLDYTVEYKKTIYICTVYV